MLVTGSSTCMFGGNVRNTIKSRRSNRLSGLILHDWMAPPSSCDQGDQEQDDEYYEQRLRDPRRGSSDKGETKYQRHNGEDQEQKSPIQHRSSSFLLRGTCLLVLLLARCISAHFYSTQKLSNNSKYMCSWWRLIYLLAGRFHPINTIDMTNNAINTHVTSCILVEATPGSIP